MLRVTMATLIALFLASGCLAQSIDVGPIDQKQPPSSRQLTPPRRGEDVDTVGLRANVTGKLPSDDTRTVYVLVNPLSNPTTRHEWWVQERAYRDGDQFECSAQFGEELEGVGEYFAIVAIATNKKYMVGERVKRVPPNATYSKLKIVKRPR
jgi:hypothetical protein